MRLVDHAKAHLVVVPVPQIGGLIAAGHVRIGERIGRIADPVEASDVITIDPDALAAAAMAPEDHAVVIAYEDDDLVVCDKPSGMHVHPLGAHRGGTLLNALLWHAGARPDRPWAPWRPAPAHRLDRAASGLVVFAKSAPVHDAIRRMLAAGTIHRRYRALVEGAVEGARGTIDAPLGRDPVHDYRRAVVPVAQGGQPAVTHWEVRARHATHTDLELVLETGRTHQIRAHLASIGHPIAGDALYLPVPGAPTAAIALRACELAFPHPRTGAPLVVAVQPGDRTMST